MGDRILSLVAALLFASVARAGEVDGTVHWKAPKHAGEPIEAIAYVTGFEQPPPAEVPTIAQRNKTFVPSLLAIVAGQSVRFTNEDDFLHNVFSTSKARPFDLGKPGPGQTREVRFPTPGVVELYCNIHETMSATLLVLPNRAFVKVGPTGRFHLQGIPAGRFTLYVWGPRLLPFHVELNVQDGETVRIDAPVEPRVSSPTHLDKYGRPYRDRGSYPP